MATSKITVELLKDMAHLGRKGQIIEVSTPQARNSLIPQGIAKEITAERMKKCSRSEGEREVLYPIRKARYQAPEQDTYQDCR